MWDATAELTRSLRATPEILRAMIGGLDDETLRWNGEGEDAWSIVEVLCHLRDAEERLGERTRRMLAEERPPLAGYDQAVLAVEARYREQVAGAALARFARLREVEATLLEGLDEKQWQRSGVHDDVGEISIRQLVTHMAAHDVTHLAQIARRVNQAREWQEFQTQMREYDSKAALIAAVQRQRETFEGLVAEVGSERIEQPGAMDDWTFKDVVAHLTGWRLMTIARVRAGQTEHPPVPPWPAELDEGDVDEGDVDAINEWFYTQNRDRPAAEVLDDARRSFDDLLIALHDTPEDALLEPGRFEWIDRLPLGPAVITGTQGHLDEHEAELRVWLATL